LTQNWHVHEYANEKNRRRSGGFADRHRHLAAMPALILPGICRAGAGADSGGDPFAGLATLPAEPSLKDSILTTDEHR
jgi:hypothetical protein